jgi:hypothetical protein
LSIHAEWIEEITIVIHLECLNIRERSCLDAAEEYAYVGDVVKSAAKRR